ncbi:MAG TPA: hypothetical protein VJR06_07210 [Nitrososphaerales archaeon]|nr:hypothetical protein [Nitrososphaerales archaeon]
MPPKRYVLLESQAEYAEVEKNLAEYLGQRYGPVKLIPVREDPYAVIVRTTAAVADQLKELRGGLVVGGTRLTPVLTSGAVGNLKRRAAEARADGQVHE